MKKITIIALLLSLSVTMLNAMEEEDFRRALAESEREEQQRQQEAHELQGAIEASLLSEQARQKAEQEQADAEFARQLAAQEEDDFARGQAPTAKLPGAEKEETAIGFEQLPAELHVHIAQFLGNTVQESMENIINLAQVNKDLYNSLLADPNNIKRIITEKFSKKEIAEAFLDALHTSTTLTKIKPFFVLHLINAEDITLLYLIKPDWLEQILSGLQPSLYEYERKLYKTRYEPQDVLNRVYAPEHLPKHILEQIEKYNTKQAFLFNLLTYLMDIDFLDPNKEYNGKTLLHQVADIGGGGGGEKIVKYFLKHGAEFKNPSNQNAIKRIRIKEREQFSRRVFD